MQKWFIIRERYENSWTGKKWELGFYATTKIIINVLINKWLNSDK